jgi:hypothetical protein
MGEGKPDLLLMQVMREVDTTGFMHNRMRMITAVSCSKHLLNDGVGVIEAILPKNFGI